MTPKPSPIPTRTWKANPFFRLRWLLFAFFCSVLTTAFAFFVLTSPSPARSQKQAIAEVKQAIGKADTRFVSVLGYSVDIPGVPDGQINGLVVVHGQKEPIGVGDYIRSWSEARRQNAAVAYGHAYNTYLLRHLLDHPDPKTRSYLHQVGQELKKFHNANPQADASRAFKLKPVFLDVAGSRELGYSIDDSRTAWVEHKWLVMNASVLRGAERRKFDEVVRSYVIPYNQALYKLLKRKWERQGVENGVIPR